MRALSALADPTRRRIVELLAQRERTAGELVAEFDMTAPAVSQHLKILRRAGLVRVRVEGQHRVQMLSPSGLVEIETWLARLTRQLERQLTAAEKSTRSAPAQNPPPPPREIAAPAPRRKSVATS